LSFGSRCLVALAIAATGCAGKVAPEPTATRSAPTASQPSPGEIEVASPSSVGIDPKRLLEMTKWIRDSNAPVFSVLVSRDGKLAYELYSSGFERDDAHYLMSVTKSLLSALVGVAVDRHALAAPENAEVSEVLPVAWFGDETNRSRFHGVTLREVMGMMAIDAQTPPRLHTPEAIERGKGFFHAGNRAVFALSQPLLEGHGARFQYNDVGPMLAAGAIAHATHEAPFDFAERVLFKPLHFRNEEWMHQDRSGLDMGGYGLRLRPIDMQKFGILFLQHGVFRGERLISEAWTVRSFSPYASSPRSHGEADYGWFWWQMRFGAWTAHAALGWKGQRIVVFPEQRLVVTMTGCFDDDGDDRFFRELVERFIEPALVPSPISDPASDAALASEVAAAHHDPSRIPGVVEARMIPSKVPKERRRSFHE
jgi:CubicO group peptidase (beta-lactamase class C family)